MTLSSRITVGFALAIIPLTVALAAPGNVTGIKGEAVNGKAKVTWQKPAGEEPTGYRVFYSRQSILQQNGLYDDFEMVQGGAATEYTFETLPYSTDVLFVSVLAVNAKGEESPLFMEEARIQLSAGNVMPNPASSAASQAALSSAASSAQAQVPAGVIRMLSAKAVSATGVLVNFSSDVSISAADAANAFVIKDASGATLRITRLVMLGKEVTIHTVKQERGRVYRLEATASVKGKENGTTIPLDPQQNDVLFAGHETGLPFGSNASSARTSSAFSQASVGPSLPVTDDVKSLTLRGQDQGTAYEVEATWQAPAAANIREYKVSQSRDGGRSYGKTQTVAAGANGVKIGGVPGGSFGIQVQTVYSDGRISRGAFQSIMLPLKGTSGKGTVGSIIQTPIGKGGKGTSLPNSGLELGIPVMLSGMGVGFQMIRRRRAQKEA